MVVVSASSCSLPHTRLHTLSHNASGRGSEQLRLQAEAPAKPMSSMPVKLNKSQLKQEAAASAALLLQLLPQLLLLLLL